MAGRIIKLYERSMSLDKKCRIVSFKFEEGMCFEISIDGVTYTPQSRCMGCVE